MPYIKMEDRIKFDEIVDLLKKYDLNSGDINYIITRIAHNHINKVGLKYSNLNDVSGAFKEALTEFERTVIAPYEDLKRKENGKIGILEIEKNF